MEFIAFGRKGMGGYVFFSIRRQKVEEGVEGGHEKVPWLGHDTWEALKGS